MNNYIITSCDLEYIPESVYCIKSALDKDKLVEEYNLLKKLAINRDKPHFFYDKFPFFTKFDYKIETLDEWFNRKCLN